MTENKATEHEVQEIRRLASDPTLVKTTTTVAFDLLAHNLTKSDVCDEIVAWIDRGERVKPTTLHTVPGLIGQRAFEMKPRINDRLFYIKVTFQQSQKTGELLLILSSHPNHQHAGSFSMRHACPICGQQTLDDKTGTFVMAVPPNVSGGDIRIANATWQACSSCGEELISDELSKAIERTRYQRLGLLSPEQIKQVRARTGLSAVEMAQVLGAGDKSYTRWENGKSVQNKATDTLIRLIDQHHELFADIDAQRSPDREPLIRNYFESLPTLKGHNHFAMAAHGGPLSSAACELIRSRLLELARTAQ